MFIVVDAFSVCVLFEVGGCYVCFLSFTLFYYVFSSLSRPSQTLRPLLKKTIRIIWFSVRLFSCLKRNLYLKDHGNYKGNSLKKYVTSLNIYFSK